MNKPITKALMLLITVSILASCTGNDPSKVQLNNHNDSLSYFIGTDYANVLKSNGYNVNPEAFYKGFNDARAETDEFPDSIKALFIDEINQESQVRQQEQIQARIQQNKEEGARFLSQNKNRQGVQQLPDGMQFKVLKQGSGPRATAADSVLIHYRAMFVDGSTFDESYQRGPQGVKLSYLTSGLSEGIQLMNAGSIYELYIPSDLAYGDQGIANVILGGETLIYNIELIKIY